ncbi:MAG: YwaF family protein [Bacilli bacterium]|nr:YwaF family protein [Bacilli bacterium]
MGEFFGKPEYGTPQGAYSWQHLLFVLFLIGTMTALAIILGKKFRNKNEELKNKVLIWCAFLIDGFELFKIAFNLGSSDDGMSWTRDLPLFLCSIQLITIPIAAFSKGKLREASLDFVFIFGILGAILGTIGAAQNYNAYPVLSFPNVVSGITHSISGFASLYIVISGMQSMKKNNIPIIFAIMFSFCVLAYIANVILDYNYMFLMNHDGTPYVIVYNLVDGNPVLYPILVVLLFVIYILLFVYLYDFIKRKIEKNNTLD